MINLKSILGGLLALSIVLGGTANAQQAKSTVKQQSLMSDILSRTTLGWGGEFYGPGINNLSDRQMSGRGADFGPIELYNSVSLGYKVDDKGTSVFVNPRFLLRPSPENTETVYVGDDLRIGVKNGSIFKSGQWNVYGKFDAKLTTTDSASLKGRILGPGLTFLTTYSVPKSRFTLDLWTYGRGYITKSGHGEFYKAADGKMKPNALFAVGFAPVVTYKISPKLAGVLYTEYNATSFGSGAFDFSTGDEDFFTKTMLSWDVSGAINFSPYVRFYPAARVAETAALGFEASASIF